MDRALRIGRRVLVVGLALVLVLVLALGGLLTWLVMRGFPQRDGTVQLPGLTAPVKVVRDEYGIANIYAASSADLFAAQGYIHASERMWQMEVWRRIGAGRLSEIFGSDQLDTDRFIRTIGWRRSAEADLAVVSPAGRAALDAYARGVNAWLDQHGDLPLPFVVAGFLGPGGGLAGYRPEPWSALDSLTWAKVQAWSLGGNWDSEIFRLLAARRGLPAERIAELFPDYDPARPYIAPGPAPTSGPSAQTDRPPLSAATDAGLAGLLDIADSLRAAVGLTSGGSNSFAVAPARSANGSALLANDPHLGISMPSVWYLVGLHCQPVGPDCPYDEAGAGFPGTPGIVLGHNARISWGLTNVNPDVEDVFEVTVDPATADHYLYRGDSLAFDVRDETINIAGGSSETMSIRSTVHGPVISDVVDDLAAGGKVYALEWTATAVPDRTLDALLAVNRAGNWAEFRAALADWGAPSQNFLYADVDGNIGVEVPGRIPIRASGDGSIVAPGEDGSHDWIGWVPYDQLPFAYNPPDGLLVTANNAVNRAGEQPYLGREWDPGYRAARITELLDTAGPITPATLRSIQSDTKLTRAQPIIDLLQLITPATDDGGLVRHRIRAWSGDLTCALDSDGCAAYETFEYRLEREVFDDALGTGDGALDIARRYVGTELAHETLVRLAAAPDDAWWRGDRDGILARALDAAGADLRATLGDPANWTWGRIHTVSFEEQTLGTSGIGPLEALFDKGPYPAPGSCTVVNKICGSISAEYPPAGETADLRKVFAASSSPSYRLVIDMGDLDGATIISTTGQSGLPFDGHYGDFISRWLANEPVPLPFTSAAVDAATRQTLTLTP